MPKIERTTSLPSTPRAQSVSRSTQAPTPSTSQPLSAAAVTAYAGQTAPARELIPGGKPVATSASPSALWGEQPKQVSLDRAEFERLAPAEKKQVLEQVVAERQRTGEEIEARVEQLDKKWKYSRLTTRTEALREYKENGRHLPTGRRQQLDNAVARSDAAQARIDALKAKIDALPKTPEAKLEMKDLRNQLARELRKARSEQSAAVKEATEVVDAEGLKIDRLATTEQIIDPNAPAPGSGESLLDKVVHFFKLDQFFQWVVSKFDVSTFVTQGFTQQVQERSERIKDEGDRKLQKLRTDAERQFTRLRDDLAFLASAESAALAAKSAR